MRYALYTLGRRRLLMTKVTPDGFGPAVADILDSFHLARHLGASVFFIAPRRPLNREIFELTCREVRVLGPRGLHAPLLRLLWRATHAWPDARAGARLWLLQRSKEWLKKPGLARERRQRIRRWRERIAAVADEPRIHPLLTAALDAVNLRREYAEAPVHVELAAERDARGAAEARALGVDPGRPIITVHVRESGYKRDLGLPERDKDSMRNASVERYRPAVRALLARGYQVVRIGDRTATPLDCPGALDLALSPLRTELVELWFLKHSRFLLGGESGPYPAALLLGTPTLLVNVTAISGIPPVRANDMYVLKQAVELFTGRPLALHEMLAPEYLLNYRAPGVYTWIENSEEEILEAALEMDAAVDAPPPPTDAQREFSDRLHAALDGELFRAWRRGKGKKEEWYVGRGRVPHAFAARRFDHATTAPEPGRS